MKESLEADAIRFDEVEPTSDGDRGPEYEAAHSFAVAPAPANQAARVPARHISEDVLEQAGERTAERTLTSVEFETGRFGETEPSEPCYSPEVDGPATVGAPVVERPAGPGEERVER